MILPTVLQLSVSPFCSKCWRWFGLWIKPSVRFSRFSWCLQHKSKSVAPLWPALQPLSQKLWTSGWLKKDVFLKLLDGLENELQGFQDLHPSCQQVSSTNIKLLGCFAVKSDSWWGRFPGGDGSAPPGGDSGVCEEAPERRKEAEGQGAAAEGLLHDDEPYWQSAWSVLQMGEINNSDQSHSPTNEYLEYPFKSKRDFEVFIRTGPGLRLL